MTDPRITVRRDDNKHPTIFTHDLAFEYHCPKCEKQLQLAYRTLSGRRQYRLQHWCDDWQLKTTARWYSSPMKAGTAYFKKIGAEGAKTDWRAWCFAKDMSMANSTISVIPYL